ncbi:MAG: hypothetical protein WC712_08050 [Candidatus Brocadiia bacterium]
MVQTNKSSDELRARLAKFVATHGTDILKDREKAIPHVKEALASDSPEAKAIIAALNSNIPADLVSITNRATAVIMMDMLRLKLAGKERISDGMARWGIESWALALGIIGASHTEGRANPFTNPKLHEPSKTGSSGPPKAPKAQEPPPIVPPVLYAPPRDHSHLSQPEEVQHHQTFSKGPQDPPSPFSPQPLKMKITAQLDNVREQVPPSIHLPSTPGNPPAPPAMPKPPLPSVAHGELSPEFRNLLESLKKDGKLPDKPAEKSAPAGNRQEVAAVPAQTAVEMKQPETWESFFNTRDGSARGPAPGSTTSAASVAQTQRTGASAATDSTKKLEELYRPAKPALPRSSAAVEPGKSVEAREREAHELKARTAEETTSVLFFGAATGGLVGLLVSALGFTHAFGAVVVGALVFMFSSANYYSKRTHLDISRPPVLAWGVLGIIVGAIGSAYENTHGHDNIVKRMIITAIIGLVGSLILTLVVFRKKSK